MAKRIRALMRQNRSVIVWEAWHIGEDGKPDAHYLWPARKVDREEPLREHPERHDRGKAE
jgi:hypothetical protein